MKSNKLAIQLLAFAIFLLTWSTFYQIYCPATDAGVSALEYDLAMHLFAAAPYFGILVLFVLCAWIAEKTKLAEKIDNWIPRATDWVRNYVNA